MSSNEDPDYDDGYADGICDARAIILREVDLPSEQINEVRRAFHRLDGDPVCIDCRGTGTPIKYSERDVLLGLLVMAGARSSWNGECRECGGAGYLTKQDAVWHLRVKSEAGAA